MVFTQNDDDDDAFEIIDFTISRVVNSGKFDGSRDNNVSVCVYEEGITFCTKRPTLANSLDKGGEV